MRIPALLLLVAALCSPAAHAGDASSLRFLGFSRDGAALAFDQTGVGDGSGFPYHSRTVVDVARNAFRYTLERSLEQDATPQSQRTLGVTVQRLSQSALARAGIVPGLRGTRLLARTLPVLGQRYVKTSPPERQVLTVGGSRFTLELRALDVPPSQPYCHSGLERGLELRLSKVGSAQTRTLQRDTRVPGSRACALSYQIGEVYLYGTSLAVFVRVQTVGFEGPDLRWMVVTARL